MQIFCAPDVNFLGERGRDRYTSKGGGSLDQPSLWTRGRPLFFFFFLDSEAPIIHKFNKGVMGGGWYYLKKK
jgi:hypothetical protein